MATIVLLDEEPPTPQPEEPEWSLLDSPHAMGLLRVMSEYADVTTPFIVYQAACALKMVRDSDNYQAFVQALKALYIDGYVDFGLYEPGVWTWCINKAGIRAAREGSRISRPLGRSFPDPGTDAPDGDSVVSTDDSGAVDTDRRKAG